MNHIKKIAEKLPEYGLDAMLVTSEPGEFYAVGFHGEGVALITEKESWYYTDSRYIEAAGELVQADHVSMPEKGRNYCATVEALIQEHGLKTVGFEEDYMTRSPGSSPEPSAAGGSGPSANSMSAPVQWAAGTAAGRGYRRWADCQTSVSPPLRLNFCTKKAPVHGVALAL